MNTSGKATSSAPFPAASRTSPATFSAVASASR